MNRIRSVDFGQQGIFFPEMTLRLRSAGPSAVIMYFPLGKNSAMDPCNDESDPKLDCWHEWMA